MKLKQLGGKNFSRLFFVAFEDDGEMCRSRIPCTSCVVLAWLLIVANGEVDGSHSFLGFLSYLAQLPTFY